MPQETEFFRGVVEFVKGGVVARQLTLALNPRPGDPWIAREPVEHLRIRPGCIVEGAIELGRRNERVLRVTRINGLAPTDWAKRKEFSEYEAVQPEEIITLEGPGAAPAARIIDLLCPIGKGQRGLIVSPPKAGKTMLLEQIAAAVTTNHADIEVVVLLVDERPEEVTALRRSIKGTVFASSSDGDREHHVRLAQFVLDYTRRIAEAGRDVVLLIDSLTRMGRAFNLAQPTSGRTLSGGVDARALEIPRRIFGSARCLEGGASLTIMATALVDTGSRMDELIFQEFKGTGSMELVLDRDLADERIFPAFNLIDSGTRREELLFGDRTAQHHALRRMISRMKPKEAMLTMLKMLRTYPTNEKLLATQKG